AAHEDVQITDTIDAPTAYRMSTWNSSVSIGTTMMPPPSPVSAPSRPAVTEPAAISNAKVSVVIARNVAAHGRARQRSSRAWPAFRLSYPRRGHAGHSQESGSEFETPEIAFHDENRGDRRADGAGAGDRRRVEARQETIRHLQSELALAR